MLCCTVPCIKGAGKAGIKQIHVRICLDFSVCGFFQTQGSQDLYTIKLCKCIN